MANDSADAGANPGVLAGAPDQLTGDRVRLRRYRWSDATQVLAVLQANRDHLARWLPWAASPATDVSVAAFLSGAIDGYGSRAADYAITEPGPDGDGVESSYLGSMSLMDRIGPGALEIGFWLDEAHTGRGLVTQAARLLSDAARQLPGIQRVEIHCDGANRASAAVPERLGFRLDRVEPSERRASHESGRSMIWVDDRVR
jgi:RimJ/RimL family protein N-acetyltransferase